MKIEVKVKPGSKREEVVQEEHGLTLRVKDPPVQGRANRAVIRLLARHFGVPEGQVRILKGFTSRHKLIEIPDSPGTGSGKSREHTGG
jgi:uncharacterized protein (TIGR00251 family)